MTVHLDGTTEEKKKNGFTCGSPPSPLRKMASDKFGKKLKTCNGIAFFFFFFLRNFTLFGHTAVRARVHEYYHARNDEKKI